MTANDHLRRFYRIHKLIPLPFCRCIRPSYEGRTTNKENKKGDRQVKSFISGCGIESELIN